MSKVKDSQAGPVVLDYLNKQNRPYSAVDIFNNLHKEYGKTAVMKALDTLVAEGKIQSKTYNKQTVYVANQTQFPDVDDADMKSMELQINALTNKLKSSTDSYRQLETELHSLNSALTTEEAKAQLAALTKEQVHILASLGRKAMCAHCREKLASIKSNTNVVSPAERQEILKTRTMYVKEWRKRKRLCMDMLNAILEGYPKSKRDLFEEIGVETDEDAGVKVPDN